MNLQILKENFDKFLQESQPLEEKLILKKYSPKNLLVVVSDKPEYKDRSAETYKSKDALKKAGFTWDTLSDESGKQVSAWVISADKMDVARATINKINGGEVSGKPDLEELVFDLATISKKSGLDQKIVGFLDNLSKQVDTAYASEEFQRYINFAKKFRNYSFSNTMLIWIQKPNATHVAGFRKWEQLNRKIKKGAKAISIFVPKISNPKQMVGKTEFLPSGDAPGALPNPNEREIDKQVASGKVLTGFTIGHVFDISDTEPIPGKDDLTKASELQWHAGNEPHEIADKISKYVEDIITELGIKYTQTGGAGEQGYAQGGSHINLSSGVAGVNKASVLVHELAHILLHFPNSLFSSDEIKRSDKQIKEYQAEAVAAAVMDEYGIPYKHSATYIAFWNRNIKELTQYTNMILKAARYIINEIDARAEKETPTETEPIKEHLGTEDVIDFFNKYKKDQAQTAYDLLKHTKDPSQLDSTKLADVLAWIKKNQPHLDGRVMQAYDQMTTE